MLVRVERLSTLRQMVNGMVYRDKDDNVCCMGFKLRNLKDWRPGRGHLPDPLLLFLTSYWRIDKPVGEPEFLGAGGWRPIRDSGVRVDHTAQLPLSGAELAVLQEALDRDFPDRHIRARDVKLEFPSAFRDNDAERQSTLHIGAYVRVASIDADDEQIEEHLRINRFALLILADGARVAYIWPYWYEECDRDPVLDVRCVRPRALNLRHFNLPVLIGTVIEQVLIVHKCTLACKEDASESHAPAECEHLCRERNACNEHQLYDCKNADCLRADWAPRMFHSAKRVHRVYDSLSGFTPDAIPQLLGATEFDSPLHTSDQRDL
jgi:hypothetical protein